MNSQILPWFHFLSLVFFVKFLILVQVPPSLSNPSDCGTKFSCGTITGVDYPFRGNEEPENCGYPGLVLNCRRDKYITTIDIMNVTYRVLYMDQSRQIMKIAREDLMEATCPHDLVNTTLDYSLFDYASTYMNLTFLYGCPVTFPGINPISSCEITGYDGGVYVFPGVLSVGNCKVSVIVPVAADFQSGFGESFNITGLGQFLREGFEVKWKLDNKACNPYPPNVCPTVNGTPSESTPSPAGNSVKENVPLTVGLSIGGAAIFGIGLGWLVFAWRQKKKTACRPICPN